MNTEAAPTNIQGWLRAYSDALANSFRASGLFKHTVTKGESREHQILDTLSQLLPTRVAVEPNVVIVDSADVQSPKFDGALVDRTLWPRIFADGNTTVVMIESVLAAIEVKSSLDKADLNDIFEKAAKLRAMRSQRGKPLVTAFAYECPNTNLSFFDFAARFYRSPEASPSSICILNKNLFALGRIVDTKLIVDDEPSANSIPVLYTANEDTLLVYLNFLSEWVTAGTSAGGAFIRYSQAVISKLTGFYFDPGFLLAINSNESHLSAARKHFERKANEDIETLYAAARIAVGLS